MKTIAELVNDLFITHRKENGRERTYKEIAEALGGTIDPSHLSRLRSGQVKSPGRDVLLGLCQYFKVPPSYFFPELEAPITEDEEENALRIVTRSAKVSPAVKQKLEELLRAMREDESQEEK